MSTTEPNSSFPGLYDFVSSVPPQLTAVLVHLQPYISFLRHAAEILSWKSSSSYDSWLTLAGWWAACLFGPLTFRYLLPVAAVFIFTFSTWTKNPERNAAPPVTEHSLQTTITDLCTIQALLPSFPQMLSTAPTGSTLLRVTAYIYAPYLILTYTVSSRIILGFVGTLVISWRASWANTIRTSLVQSAYVRWAIYHTWALVSGQPLPPMTQSFSPTQTSPDPVNAVRFLFTVYENQRWWMGLDWTAALLPNERPSWCSSKQEPVQPPNAFSLPDPTTVYLADERGRRVKRTATWSWEEPEWKVVVVAGDGATRVERPLPTLKEESPGLLTKAASKMREAGANVPSEEKVSEDSETTQADEDVSTDPDGWIYSDNKWEGKTNKGGIGKYTRYRRWTRIATVQEVVHVVDDDGEMGIERPRGRSPDSSTEPMTRESSPSVRSSSPSSSGGSPLRQRLRTALAMSP
ncbi:Peroxin/Dysferlin domain-containing protein [Mycena floridula]|nr:Peroxin/Dysferlin domain-containing protein [Mycena floridula]